MDVMRVCAVSMRTKAALINNLQFQYAKVAAFALRSSKVQKKTETRAHSLEHKYQAERAMRTRYGEELDALKGETTAFVECKKRLEKWEERRDAINHYLNMVGEMSRYDKAASRASFDLMCDQRHDKNARSAIRVRL